MAVASWSCGDRAKQSHQSEPKLTRVLSRASERPLAGDAAACGPYVTVTTHP